MTLGQPTVIERAELCWLLMFLVFANNCCHYSLPVLRMDAFNAETNEETIHSIPALFRCATSSLGSCDPPFEVGEVTEVLKPYNISTYMQSPYSRSLLQQPPAWINMDYWWQHRERSRFYILKCLVPAVERFEDVKSNLLSFWSGPTNVQTSQDYVRIN